MQRPAPRKDHPAHGDLEVEVALAGERASALGRAGTRLEDAVAAYRLAVAAGGLSPDQEEELLDRVTSQLYRLLVQRECAGARSENLRSIQRAYRVPDAAVRRL